MIDRLAARRNLKMSWTPWQIRCDTCGRFVRWGEEDTSAPFDTAALEPPDDEHYCPRCARELEEYYVEQGWVPNDWIKAGWQRRAAARLGLVEAKMGPRTAWTSWFKPDKVPDGWILVSKEPSHPESEKADD